MTTLARIEEEIRQLPPQQMRSFREWFLRYDAKQWDLQIEEDIHTGKLDALANKALDDFRQGRKKAL